MTKIEFYSMLADWNDKERKNWLAETKHTTVDYREILFSYVHIYEKILPSDIIIKEYGYFGGVRCSKVYLLDCGANPNASDNTSKLHLRDLNQN
jgi:hypothetical protein